MHMQTPFRQASSPNTYMPNFFCNPDYRLQDLRSLLKIGSCRFCLMHRAKNLRLSFIGRKAEELALSPRPNPTFHYDFIFFLSATIRCYADVVHSHRFSHRTLLKRHTPPSSRGSSALGLPLAASRKQPIATELAIGETQSIIMKI